MQTDGDEIAPLADVDDDAAHAARLEALQEAHPGAPIVRAGRTRVLAEGRLAWLGVSKHERRPHDSTDVDALLFDDALLLLQGADGGRGGAPVELPLAAARVEDLLAEQRRTGVASAFRVEAAGAVVTLQAPSPPSAEAWVRRVAGAVAAAAPADARLERGWLHRRVRGTLCSAALEGDAAAVRELCAYTLAGRARAAAAGFAGGLPAVPLQPCLDIDAPDAAAEDGASPLHCAVVGGHADAVAALLEAGARTDVVDADYDTPLHAALARGDADAAVVLIANGAPLDARNLVDATPLDTALARVRDDDALCAAAASLLAYGAAAGEPDLDGLTPLHRVALRGRPGVARLVAALVRHGAAVDARAAVALHGVRAAAEHEHDHAAAAAAAAVGGADAPDDVTPLLIACGVPVAPALRVAAGGATDDDDEGDGGGCAGSGLCADVVAALLAAGAEPNARVGRALRTPLLAALAAPGAAADAVCAVAVALVRAGARFDVADAAGVTPADLLAGSPDALAAAVATARSDCLLAAPPAGAVALAPAVAARAAAAGRARGCRRDATAALRRRAPGAGGGFLAAVARTLGGGGATAAPAAPAPRCACGAAAAEPACGWCGVRVCDRCGAKSFPLPPEVDSDSDDEGGGGGASGGGRGRGAASGRRGQRAVAGGGGQLNGLIPWLAPPPPGSLQTAAALSAAAPRPPTAAPEVRVCDACFNVLAAAADEVSGEVARVRARESAATRLGPAPPVAAPPAPAPAPPRATGNPRIAATRATAAAAGAGSETAQRAALLGTGSSGAASGGRGAGRGRAAAAPPGAPPNAAAARAAAHGLQADLAETRERLAQRGEKVSELQDASARMAASAGEFGDLAGKLKAKMKGGFFGF